VPKLTIKGQKNDKTPDDIVYKGRRKMFDKMSRHKVIETTNNRNNHFF